MVKLADRTQKGGLMRDTYTNTLIEIAKENPELVVFDADLIGASGLAAFKKAYPDRAFDCGIQEANMTGVAAGMSESGAIPVIHTFSCFASRKIVDQVFLSASYANLNLKIIGSDPAISAQTNGGSHQGMEDMGIYLGLHDITLVDLTDAVMAKAVIPKLVEEYGVVYMRAFRRGEDNIYEEGTEFTVGKGLVLRDGDDATIIASGLEVKEALDAADMLEEKGISVRVIDMFTWKPLDRELIVESAKKTGAIVVAENHSLGNGLGKQVAAVTAEECPVPMGFIGVDYYGEVGNVQYLKERFHMTGADIAAKVEATIAKK